jgi:four helix bundle protein
MSHSANLVPANVAQNCAISAWAGQILGVVEGGHVGRQFAIADCVNADDLKARTFAAAVKAVAFARLLTRGPVDWVLSRQLIASGTSVAAQYRAACRAQSTRDFISKMKKMEEEADETVLWLSLLRADGLPEHLCVEAMALESEYRQLTAIAVASIKTARKRLARESAAGRRTVPVALD